jgi:hypothetical protein
VRVNRQVILSLAAALMVLTIGFFNDAQSQTCDGLFTPSTRAPRSESFRVQLKKGLLPGETAKGSLDTRYLAAHGISWLTVDLRTVAPDGKRDEARNERYLHDIVSEMKRRGFEPTGIDQILAIGETGLVRSPDDAEKFGSDYRAAVVKKHGVFDLPPEPESFWSHSPVYRDFVDALVEAARTSWMGRQMAALGYQHVLAIEISKSDSKSSNASLLVKFRWMKAPSEQPTILLATPTEPGKPSEKELLLPLLHELIGGEKDRRK